MQFRGLNLNLLVALDALLTERSITRAAETIHLSQSGMSTALARLREFFSDPLLVQIGRQMTLTPLAESLINPLHDVLLQVQSLVAQRPAFDPVTTQRRFTIMASDYVGTVYLPRLLERIQQLAPNMVIDIRSQEDMFEGILDRGEVDFLIMPSPSISGENPSAPLFTDTYVCIGSIENTDLDDLDTFHKYMKSSHVVTRFGKTRLPTYDNWMFQKYGHSRNIGVVAMNFGMVPYYVAGTKRIATVHGRLAQMYEKMLPIRIVPVPFEIPILEESLQWHKHNDRHPATSWLRDLMCEVAKKMKPQPTFE